MEYQHDFKPPNQSEFEEIPEGWHDFNVFVAYDKDLEGQPLVTSQGVPYLKLKCEPEGINAHVTHALFLEAGNARKLDAFLWATGLGVEGESVDWRPANFEHLKFSGKVVMATANGANFPKIVRVCPIGHNDAKEPEIKSAGVFEINKPTATDLPF